MSVAEAVFKKKKCMLVRSRFLGFNMDLVRVKRETYFVALDAVKKKKSN